MSLLQPLLDQYLKHIYAIKEVVVCALNKLKVTVFYRCIIVKCAILFVAGWWCWIFTTCKLEKVGWWSLIVKEDFHWTLAKTAPMLSLALVEKVGRLWFRSHVQAPHHAKWSPLFKWRRVERRDHYPPSLEGYDWSKL